MSTCWTDNQKIAISHRDCSMIVSAAAGSGKTAVLVERIISMLDTVDIDKMLVVTFTNAAAASMKQRIHSALLKKLESSETEEEIAHFNRQLSLLGASNINTLHAFCSKFVREHFDALNLSPSVKLGETSALNLMLEGAIDSAICEKYEAEDEDFMTFAKEVIGKTNDSVLSEILLDLYKFLMSLPDPLGWLTSALEVYETEDVDKFLSANAFILPIKEELKRLFSTTSKNLQIVQNEPNYQYALSHFEADFDFAERLLKASEEGFTSLCDEFSNLPKRKSVVLKVKTASEETVKFLGDLREPVKTAFGYISKEISACSVPRMREMMRLQKPRIRAVVSLLKRTIEIYTSQKREKDLLDFNDLEHLTISLLYNDGKVSDLAKEVSQNFECITVDEYQDINPVQEAIICALSKNKENLFMVGDVKQGIYGFRNTTSALFAEKVSNYSQNIGGKCVYLSDNFRSRNCVLDFANLVFSQIMSLSFGGSDYTDNEALHKKGTFLPSDESTEVYVITDESFKKDSAEAEAIFTAQKIHELINSGFKVSDKSGALRDASYGDFAILLRSAKNTASIFTEVLTAMGIPVYCDAVGENFLESTEILSLLSFLKAFDNPLRDVDLLSAFTSPVFGEPDYDLAVKVRLVDKSKTLFECMQNYKGEGEDKISEFLEFICKWRKKASYLPVSRLISELLAETSYADFVAVLKGGDQRLQNIRYLQNIAEENYPNKESGGLYAFLNHLEKHSKSKEGLSSPKILPENSNMVQITTIHKSKGLEYPIVIIPCCGKEFNLRGGNSYVNFHKDFGLGMSYQNIEKSLKIDSPMFKIIKEVKAEEEKAEELRVLYVALTRAMDKTIVTGYKKDFEKLLSYAKSAENHEEILLPQSVIKEAKSYLEWILLALQRREKYALSNIKLSFINQIFVPEITESTGEELTPKEASKELINRLSYTYPKTDVTKVYSKVSVTELKRILAEDNSDAYKPYYAKSTAVSFDDNESALKKGTVTHFILQNLDFSERQCEKTIENLVLSGRLTQNEADLADVNAINRFLNSPLCDILRNSSDIKKELSFNIHIDGGILDKGAQGEPVQLQGTMDLIAKVNDELILVDFKTDRINNNLEEKIALYKPQAEFYRLGAEKLFPNTVIHGFLYFLDTGEQAELF